RVTTWLTDRPPQPVTGVRPRVGFNPKVPHAADGMRIDPPPSLAVATGTMPATTAAAEPPLDPPTVRVGFHGFAHAPYATGSVVASSPASGMLVIPMGIAPSRR